MSIFEQASRQKIRFETQKGLLSVEDLWDVPLTATSTRVNLDDIARELYKELDGKNNISFVDQRSSVDSVTQLKFDLVKHVIDIRVAERAVARQAQVNKEQKAKILGIIDQKQNEALSSASIEELRDMLKTL